MKSELEILIDHLENEVDHLKSSMDECIAEWDFDGAKAFREPFIYTQRKLRVLKCLQNPNYDRISTLIEMISRMEIDLNQQKSTNDNIDERTRKRMEHFNKFMIKRIEQYKIELDELKSIIPEKRIDDDKILNLLDELETNQLKNIEFELIENKIFLNLSLENETAKMKFSTKNNARIEDYLVKATKSILIEMGFDIEIYSRTINDYRNIDKLKVLEELAIITFEVFNIRSDENMNIKIE